jgi:nucleoside-diphosphate-sugar epimerase
LLNIGAGRACMIREVVNIILDAVNHLDVRVVFDHTKPVTIPFRMLNVEKARRLLGFVPEISLEQGLRDTVQWYLKNLADSEGKSS